MKRGNTLEHVKVQAKKQNFKIDEKPVMTESGELLGLFLFKENVLVLIVVMLRNKIFWIDVLEKGTNINGIVVGSDLFKYHKEGLNIKCYGHRDSSLDDIVCVIGDVKALIDYQYFPLVREYQKSEDPNLLKKIFIKGIELK